MDTIPLDSVVMLDKIALIIPLVIILSRVITRNTNFFS
jgi:hypothetical protein